MPLLCEKEQYCITWSRLATGLCRYPVLGGKRWQLCHFETCLACVCVQVAEDYGFQRVLTTEELDLSLPHAAPFSVATTSGVLPSDPAISALGPIYQAT